MGMGALIALNNPQLVGAGVSHRARALSVLLQAGSLERAARSAVMLIARVCGVVLVLALERCLRLA